VAREQDQATAPPYSAAPTGDVSGGCCSVTAEPSPEINHSPASSAEDKNEWSYTAASTICLRGADRKNFTLVLV
jgi:hypothetical protein